MRFSKLQSIVLFTFIISIVYFFSPHSVSAQWQNTGYTQQQCFDLINNPSSGPQYPGSAWCTFANDGISLTGYLGSGGTNYGGYYADWSGGTLPSTYNGSQMRITGGAPEGSYCLSTLFPQNCVWSCAGPSASAIYTHNYSWDSSAGTCWDTTPYGGTQLSNQCSSNSYYECYALSVVPPVLNSCDPVACYNSWYTSTCTTGTCVDGYNNPSTAPGSACVPLDNGKCTAPTPENCSNGVDDDGDGLVDSNDPDCPPAPTFTISLTPSTQSVALGGAVTYNVVITPLNGFTESVNLSQASCDGYTCRFNGNTTSYTVAYPYSNVVLTVTTSGTTPVGIDSFNVNGSSNSVPSTGTNAFVSVTNVSCNPAPGVGFMKGCLYDGTNFDVITSTSVNEATIATPALNATPIPLKDWGGSGPDVGNIDTYSIRWKGTFNFSAGTYTFTAGSDDGVRVYFDDNLDGSPDSGYIVNSWIDRGYTTTASAPISVAAGNHTLVMEFYENGGGSAYSLSWVGQVVNATVSLSASPSSIPYNTASNVSWTSTNATGGCTVSPTGWTGTSGSQSTGNLTASRTYTVTCNPGSVTDSATVNVANPTVNVNVVTTGQGTVVSTSNPVQTNINCGNLCSSAYDVGTVLTLTATPSSGRVFVGWGGDCSGTNSICSLTVNGTKSVQARFAIDPNFKEF